MKPNFALAATVALAAAACSPRASEAPVAAAQEEASSPLVMPEAVNGWREYPLREGVIKTHPAEWRHEVIDIRVPPDDKGLEYKLHMNAGDAIVYSTSYGDLEHPGLMVVEFHGHTEKGADGNGDLMFYSNTGGTPENGSFTAPWSGIHGWYLKNDSEADVIVRLEVAGFYERTDQ